MNSSVSGCFSLPIHTHSEGRASKYGHPSVYSGSSQAHGCTLGVATLIFHSAQLRAVLQPWSYSWPPLYPLVASTGSTLSASSRFLWASSLFPSEMRKNPPTPSRNGDVRFAGEASFCLFVLMVEPGGQHQNPLMVQSRHTRAKNRLIITSSVDPGKSCRQQGFRINRDVSFSVATSKNIPNSTPNLTLTLPDDLWMILCTLTGPSHVPVCCFCRLLVQIKNGSWRKTSPWRPIHKHLTFRGESPSQADDDDDGAQAPVQISSGFTGFTGSAYHPTFSGKVWLGNFSLIVFSGLSCIIAFHFPLA